MKGLILSIIVISGLSVLASNAFAESLFYGSSSFERLHSMTPGMSSGFEIKIQYTAGLYQIGKLSPVFDVSPKDAASYVQIKANPLDGLSRNDVGRIQGTMSVDSQIQHDKIFVTVSFDGLDSYGNTYRSAWTDSATVDVKRAAPSENMTYSQFLDFCSIHDPTLWESMSIGERQLSNLCGLPNIGERQWAWLNGTALDWRNFAQKSAEEYAADIPLYKEQGISDTLVVRTAVSGRDSFPPPMTGGISFSYGDSGKISHYSSRIVVGLEGIDETKYEPFECKHPVSGASIGRPLDLQYDITGGVLLDLCKNDDTNSVIAKVDAGYGGEMTLTVPKKVVYSLTSTDCADDSELIILVNNEETLATKSVHDKKDNVITVTFPKGHHTIEFIGASIMPDPSPVQYCGVVMGFDSLYLPPKFQVERGMKPDRVKCNDGLVLVTKSSDSSPACITLETKQVLVERGWAKELSYDVQISGQDAQKICDVLKWSCTADQTFWGIKIGDKITVEQQFDGKTYRFELSPSEFCYHWEGAGVSLCRTDYPTVTISSLHDPRPDALILEIGVNNTVYWKNESDVPVTLASEDGRWSTGVILPNDGKTITFNQTAFYEYRGLPHAAINGRIAIISDETGSLPISERLQIAREIIKVDMGNPITGIGVGNAGNVLAVTIHEDELKNNQDAESYYKKRYSEMIPFDVPIRISFGHASPD